MEDPNEKHEKLTHFQNLALLGHYDLWVKRGVVSLMGAKLHPSPRLYRVYAPSTHSLPVIKCVSGVDGEAEVEIRSCHSGIYRLRDLSPQYQRMWNGKNTAADKLTLKGAAGNTRRTFSVVCSDSVLQLTLEPLSNSFSAAHVRRRFSKATFTATSS